MRGNKSARSCWPCAEPRSACPAPEAQRAPRGAPVACAARPAGRGGHGESMHGRSGGTALCLDAADRLDRQAQTAALVRLEDLDPHRLADLQHVVDVGDAVVGDFRDVQQAIAARQDLDDGAEIQQARTVPWDYWPTSTSADSSLMQ